MCLHWQRYSPLFPAWNEKMLEIKLGQKETRKNIFIWNDKKKQEIVEDNPPDASSPIPSVVVRGASKSSRAVGLLGEVHLWGNIMKSCRRLYSYLLLGETTCCKTPHFQWIYGKLSQIYEKLRSDQMDPKSALGGPKPIARTGRSLLKNWSYTSNPCIYFSILLDWRAHLAKTLFIPHKYIKCALL